MATLNELNNVQKAKMLHALFIHEMPGFLAYLTKACEHTRDHEEQVRSKWENGMLAVDTWLDLCAETLRIANKYGKSLKSSSTTFAEQLFYGYGAVVLIHLLHEYIKTNSETNPKFKTAVELFF